MIYQANTQSHSDHFTESGATFIGTEIFPAVLHSMLDEVEEKGLAHIVSWQPHGQCFVVHKRKEFVQFIMPAYFRMSKFASFQRQLNLYDFSRITAGPDKGGYYHEHFVRGRKSLCKFIQRHQVKGTITRKPAPDTEPDFYRAAMVRYLNANKAAPMHNNDVTTASTSLSDLMMNARFPSSQANRVAAVSPSFHATPAPGFSSVPNTTDAMMMRQAHNNMVAGQFQNHGGDYPLRVAIGAEQRPPAIRNYSSESPFFQNESSDHCVVNQDSRSELDCESLIAMIRPCHRSMMSEEMKHFMRMNNYGESSSYGASVANDHQPSPVYHGINNTGFESYSTTYAPTRQSLDAPLMGEHFGIATDNNQLYAENTTFYNENSQSDWVPLDSYH